MSTRSLIAIKQNDQYIAIYCHFDGYDHDQGVGPTLREFFNSEREARELVYLGDLSSIQRDKVIAYHRDRKELWSETKPRRFDSLQALMNHASDCFANYIYIFENDEWITHKSGWF